MDSETGAAAPTDGKETGEIVARNGFGIPAAASALAMSLRFFATARPGTPLRAASLIAIDAVLRGRGKSLKPDQRRAVIEAMELGALLNDRFDGDLYPKQKLRSAVSWFQNSSSRELVKNYAKLLRHYERDRPQREEGLTAITRYRENVNRLSLAMLWALATNTSLESAQREVHSDNSLQLLFRIIMQCQLIDDVLDIRKDRLRSLPSLATTRDVSALSLRKLASFYSGVRSDAHARDSCLWLALQSMATCARLVILVFRARIQPLNTREMEKIGVRASRF